jgi:hypothetical protein
MYYTRFVFRLRIILRSDVFGALSMVSSNLSKANAGCEGLRAQMIVRAVPAEALVTGRATLAGQVEGDGPDERALVLQVGG